MRTADEIFTDWYNRRKGIVRALTTDSDKLFDACDPNKENLCLYGLPDGNWAVDTPADEVPPESPEPVLGINFARDGMQRHNWLALVAVHSDVWLMSVAFYFGARLDKYGRATLFDSINDYPTCFELVTGRAQPGNPGRKRAAPSGGAAARARPAGRAGGSRGRYEEDDDGYDEDEGYGEEDDGGDEGGDPCPNCGRRYREGEFWIACDYCDTWFDGKCVNMTAQKAEKFGKWKCPLCLSKQSY